MLLLARPACIDGHAAGDLMFWRRFSFIKVPLIRQWVDGSQRGL